MEYTEFKRLGNSKLYCQFVWDTENRKGHLAFSIKKADGTFELKSDDWTKDFLAKIKAAPTLQTPIKID